MLTQVASATRPPAVPYYILRGHSAQVHALHFCSDNLRLISGDADGWIVLWDLITKRAAAVWRAHDNTILGVGSWGKDKIITHGRDSKLIVWQLRQEDEAHLNKILPIEDAATSRPKPWILHVLNVHTLNFCSFASCLNSATRNTSDVAFANPEVEQLLIATPGLQDGCIVITSLPNDSRRALIPPPKGIQSGMLMSVSLIQIPTNENKSVLHVLAGYESGHVALWTENSSSNWQAVYLAQPHSQPVLSVSSASLENGSWYSSSADAILARHPLHAPWDTKTMQTVQTRHAGQQGLSVRSDDAILATAGWDGRMRVYSTADLTELAVLKWHKEGCYSTAFTHIRPDSVAETNSSSTELATSAKHVSLAEQRLIKARTQHLLAAGSKDGKISLWEIY